MAEELDPQARELLDDMATEGSLPAHALSVAGTRADFEATFAPDDPEPVETVRDESIPGGDGGIPIRLYLPEGDRPLPVLVFAHGGGWVRGSVDTHDELCRSLATEVGCAVVSVDYRRPPEHPFPAALEDVHAAIGWVAEFGSLVHLDPDRIAVGGDSAGGNLAAAAALLAGERGGPDLDHQLLVYPVLDRDPGTASYREYGEGYVPTRGALAWYWEQYLRTPIDARNPYAAPLRARDPGDAAPATILTAGFDPLRDEGRAYAERLRDAGVDVTELRYEGMIHGFLSFPGRLDRAADARGEIAAALGTALGL